MTARRQTLFALAIAAGAIAGCSRPAPVVPVDRFETTVALRPDGSLEVEEHFTVSSAAAGMTLVREVRPPQADGVQLEATRLDGAFQGGPDAGIVAESRGRALELRWRVPSDGAPAHVLTIAYRVIAALRVDEPRAYLAWTALPAGRAFDVRTAALTLVVPRGLAFHEGTGIAEAGWTVARHDDGISAVRDGVPAAEPAAILGEFDLRPPMAEGQWQIDVERQADLLPAYASAALFMLVIGVGTQVILRAQHPRRRANPVPDAERLQVARGLLTTAWVGALVAIACALFAYIALPRLGRAIQLIPAGMILVAILFVWLAARWKREGLGLR